MHYDDLCEVFFSSSLEVYPGYFCILHIDHDKKLIVYAISFNKKRAGNVILASFFFPACRYTLKVYTHYVRSSYVKTEQNLQENQRSGR